MSEEYQRFRATAIIDTHEAQVMIQLPSPTIPKLSSTIWEGVLLLQVAELIKNP